MCERSNAEKAGRGRRMGLAMETLMIAMGVGLVSAAAIAVAYLLAA